MLTMLTMSLRSERLRAPALYGAGVTAAVALLAVRDPHQSGSYGYCPWLLLTGTFCPGCGGLRAVHDLSHLDVAGALSTNLLLVVLAPVAVLLWLLWVRARWQDRRLAPPVAATPALWSLVAVVLLFGLARNLPAAAWLAP
jgi:hypothetical protein